MLSLIARRIGLAVVAATLTGPPAAAQSPAPVRIANGLVRGVVHEVVEAFKGLPYAAAPVGTLRWRAPQPPPPWDGVRSADRFGLVCMQAPRPPGGSAGFAAEEMSEDCLTLNVWRPIGARKLPVMVWIHGGAMVAGTSSAPTYDGEVFARNGVVLVSLNYRLGRLGIFAHPSLSAENADGGRLWNYALMDQIAALQWVARNIAAFGGDPS